MTTLINPTTLPADVACIGYVRVSTERQAGEIFTSLSDQETAILALAQRLGVTVGAWYRDEGASGATVEQRPAFSALLAACEAARRKARSPGLVLVLNDSRFGRFPDPEEAAYWRVHLSHYGWRVRFAESDDTEDATTRTLMRAIGGAQASQYRKAIQDNAKRGAKGTMSQGFWCREAPFGYRRKVVWPAGRERVLEIGVRKATDEKVMLTPYEPEAEVVRWMFQAYASGSHSLYTLSHELAARVPGRDWHTQSIRLMLKNPAYVGDVVGGRRPADKRERERHRIRPKDQWYGKKDAHPAIVSREVFAAVRARFERNQTLTRAAVGGYLLTGILRCPYCGYSYSGGGGGARIYNAGHKRQFYKCGGGVSPGRPCPGPIGTVMRHLVDDAVREMVLRHTTTPRARAQILRELDRVLTLRAEAAPRSVAALNRERAGLERKQARLVGLLADGTLTKAEAAPELDRIRASIARVTDSLHEARFAERRTSVVREERDRFAALLADVPARLAAGATHEQRELLRWWVAGATFDKVTRKLTVELWRVPPMLALHSDTVPAHDVGEKGRRARLYRTVPLLQKGHDYRVAQMRAAVEADMPRVRALAALVGGAL